MALADILKAIEERLGVDSNEAQKILQKAEFGSEITETFTAEQWLNERFLPNCVMIDEDGYARMCIDALKILGTTAPTDYGSSRQRDLGQLWADMTRGYLGEYAFVLFLKKKCNIDAELGHEVGKLEEYLPMDIHKVKRAGGQAHTPRLNVAVKTTKWNGIWMDIPGDQFNHSDIHVLVKVGAGRDHLLAFFKKISVFKDKVLKRGEDMGSLTKEESGIIYDKLPVFKPIPAYICGFVRKTDKYSNLSYSGSKGRMHFKIHQWNGPINPGDLDTVKAKEGLLDKGKVQFEGIGEFSHDKGYLFNTGNLLWKEDDWKSVCDNL